MPVSWVFVKRKEGNIDFGCSSLGNFRELVEYLLESTELLAKNGNILDNVLETLDIQQHSLGVLFVLVVKFSEPNVRGFDSLCIGFVIFMHCFILRRITTTRKMFYGLSESSLPYAMENRSDSLHNHVSIAHAG